MDQETQQQIKDRYNALPLELQQAIDSADVGNKITEIGKKYSLLIDQENDLYMEIFLAMLGLEPLADLTKNITKNVRVSTATAVTITQDVNKEIFLPIRESLQKIQLPKEDTEPEESTSNPERDQILHDIENPTPTPARKVAPITDPERELSARAATDDFVGKQTFSIFSFFYRNFCCEEPLEKKYVADPYREPTN